MASPVKQTLGLGKKVSTRPCYSVEKEAASAAQPAGDAVQPTGLHWV
mgnify:CR=1 FL=1